MKYSENSKGKSFTAFRSAAEEADTKRETDAMQGDEHVWGNEGGHMGSTAGRVTGVPRADLQKNSMNDEDILARLKVIDQRLRQISTEDAASVLASGMANAGIHAQERLRLIAETEHILDELDGTTND
jgi:hypothetical protein